MTTPKDFRIGNYVSTTEDKSFAIQNGWELDEGRELHPVKLTEEWLEKFGFEMHPDWNSKATNESTSFLDLGTLNISRNRMGGLSLCDKNGVSTGAPIEFVHQLQNLYFALTGEELEYKE